LKSSLRLTLTPLHINAMPITSPLRYPGGKSKAIRQIIPYLPAHFTRYREPFVGGGSLFIHLKQQRPDRAVWINDLNYDLYCFWQAAQRDLPRLVAEIERVQRETTDGRALFTELTTTKAGARAEPRLKPSRSRVRAFRAAASLW
jgi:DNA adenine methylase